MSNYSTIARDWFEAETSLQKTEFHRAPKGVPTYVGVLTVTTVVMCFSLHIALGITAVLPVWMSSAALLRVHSNEIEHQRWVTAGGTRQGNVVQPSGIVRRIRERLPGPPSIPTLLSLAAGCMWVLVFFGNDIATRAREYSSRALSSTTYAQAMAMAEPGVLGFYGAEPCYYIQFSDFAWLFAIGPLDEFCYSVASFLTPPLTLQSFILIGCTFLVVPVWWIVVGKSATRILIPGSKVGN